MPRLPKIPVWSDKRREAKYETLKAVYESKGIPFKDFRKNIIGLIESQRDADAKRAQRQLAAEEAKEAAAEAKARGKKEQKIIGKARDSVELNKDFNGEALDIWLVPVFNGLGGGTYRRIILRGGEVSIDDTIVVSGKYKEFRLLWGISENTILESGDKVLLMSPNKIEAKKIAQIFRDGVSHCVFEPIKKKLEERLSKSETDYSKKRYKQRINKLTEMEALYAKGVPEDKMEEVAVASGLCVFITDMFGGVVSTYNEKAKHRGWLRLINTRENHLDTHITSNDEPIQVNEIEMKRLYKKAYADWKSENKFFHFDFLQDGIPRKLYLLDATYCLKNEHTEVMEQFSKSINLRNYKFDATKYPDVNEFIKEGSVVNSWPTTISGGDAEGHIDLDKAYTQFKKCVAYRGFLGLIHQWRSGDFDKEWLEEHIGIYRCKIESDNELFLKLGIPGVRTMPSVLILYLMSRGCVVSDINYGVWGSRMDFEFSEDMLVSKKRYAHWTGKLAMEYEGTAYSFHCSKSWMSHLKATLNPALHKVSSFEDVCKVSVKKDTFFTWHHIAAFVTAYTQINMMEAMKRFDVENIVRVVMDGIYYRGDMPFDYIVEGEDDMIYIGELPFKAKELKKNPSYTMPWYSDASVEVNWGECFVKRNTLLTGQGGSGKTYSIVKDSGYNNVKFVSPSHVLGKEVFKKDGVSYVTIHKLIGIECAAYREEHPPPPVLLVDEVTQLDGAWVEKIFELYPESLIILAGDLDSKGQWFQCRGGTPGDHSVMWKPHGVDIIDFLEDRRSEDDLLKQLKLDIRSEMRRVFVDGNSGECRLMEVWARNNLKTVEFFDAVGQFEDGDTWIAGTHRIHLSLLAAGVVSGWWKQGGEISDVEAPGFQKRGSFTIHAYQGKTIRSGKIFISLKDMFERAMLYTAVSRAVRFSQLVFVA